MALVRHSTAIDENAVSWPASRAISCAIALASDAPSGLSQTWTWGPLASARNNLGSRPGLFAMRAAAAATMRRELRRFRPKVMVRARRKLARNRSRLAREAPRKR